MSSDKEERVDLKPVEFDGFGRVEDSRLKGYRETITHPSLPLERTFCNNCGKPYGWVSVESSQLIAAAQVVVFCEECEDMMNKKLGPIPLRVAGDKNTTEFTVPVAPPTRTNAIAGEPQKRGLL